MQQALEVARQIADQVDRASHGPPATPHDGARRIALQHHALQVRARLGGHVEIRIELAPHAFQGEKGLDHQCQIRWQRQPVIAQDGGDVAKHCANTQFFQRHAAILVDERTDVLLQTRLVDLQAGARPFQQDVDHRFGVVADHAVQQLCDLKPTLLGDAPDHAEIDDRDAPVAQVKNVPRMRVGVEAAVLQHHLEHDAGTGTCERPAIQAGRIDGEQIAPRNPIDEFLHVERLAGPLPVHRRHHHLRIVREVGGDAFGVAPLGSEVQLASQRDGKLLYHLGRTVALEIRCAGFDDFSKPGEQAQIRIDGVTDIGTTDLQHHRGAIDQPRAMRLCQRCGRQRLFVQAREDAFRLHTQRGDQLRTDLIEWQRRHRVLQLAQFFDPLRRQQVHARGQHLAQFDEGWPELFQCTPHAHRCGHAQPALGILPMQQPAGALKHIGQADTTHHIAEAVADQDRGDFLQTPKITYRA